MDDKKPKSLAQFLNEVAGTAAQFCEEDVRAKNRVVNRAAIIALMNKKADLVLKNLEKYPLCKLDFDHVYAAAVIALPFGSVSFAFHESVKVHFGVSGARPVPAWPIPRIEMH